ncbi:FCD domain-containing protein [Catenulispora yoronensis]
MERGDVTWESEVLAAHHRMASLPIYLDGDPSTRNEEWARAHLIFHHKLIEACDNPVLLDICVRLSDAAELYRAWSGPGTRETHRDVAGEHKGLLDAALAHEADHGVALFEAHVDRTQAILADSSFSISPGTNPGTSANPSTSISTNPSSSTSTA